VSETDAETVSGTKLHELTLRNIDNGDPIRHVTA